MNTKQGANLDVHHGACDIIITSISAEFGGIALTPNTFPVQAERQWPLHCCSPQSLSRSGDVSVGQSALKNTRCTEARDIFRKVTLSPECRQD